MKIQAILVAVLFFCRLSAAYAQGQADSLINLLSQVKGVEKIELLLKINKAHSIIINNNSAQFIQHTQEAITVADSLKDQLALTKLYLTLGNLQQRLGNANEALANYFKAADVYEDAAFPGDKAKVGEVFNNIGILYKRQGDIDKSLEYYKKALAYAKEGEGVLLGMVYGNIATIYRIKNEYQLALEYNHRSIQAHTASGNERLTATPFQNLGILYGFMGEHDKALEFMHKALEQKTKNEDVEGVCYSHVNLGDEYKLTKNYDKALFHLKEALSISKQKGYKLLTSHALLYLSQTFTEKGEHAKANALLTEHIAYKDSLFNEESAAKMAEMEAKYNSATQQKEIALLKAEQSLKEAELKERKAATYALAIGFIFVLVMLFLIYRQYRLKKRTNEVLKQYNKDIQEKNLFLEDMNFRLQSSEEELRQLNATKDKFFSILSHDLRSPMNSFSGLLELISNSSSNLSKEELVQLTSKLNSSVKNINSLLNNLLQWSMAQMGKLSCQPVQFGLKDFIEENVSIIRLAAESKGIRISLHLEEGLEILSDRNMLDFVVRNLLSNAVKFTPGGGEISIITEHRNLQTVITVRDTGVGIPAVNLAKLFRIGEHKSTQGTAKETGTGLGLILCKEFIERNGGTLSVVSKMGENTSFIITIPALPVTASSEHVAAMAV